MRHWKFTVAALATGLAAGTFALTMPTETAATSSCDGEFAIYGGEVVEGEGQLTFTVTLSNPTGSCTHSVWYEPTPAEPNPATSGADFDSQKKQLTWQGEPATQQATVSVVDDDDAELAESVRVTLFSAAGGHVVTPSAIGTILNNDGVGGGPGSVRASINPDGSTPDCTSCRAGSCLMTVGLSDRVTFPVTIFYATFADTALDGEDFIGVRDGRVTVPAGETRATFSIEVLPNLPGERTESFEIRLTGVSYGTIDHGHVEVHILGIS